MPNAFIRTTDPAGRQRIQRCLDELCREPEDEDLVAIAKEWARMSWTTADGTVFKLSTRRTTVEVEEDIPALRASPDEVRAATQEYLKCLLARKSGHTRFILPKMAVILSSRGPSDADKVDECFFLRHHCPFGIRPKIPIADENGVLTSFEWPWMPVDPSCPFEELLSDLSTVLLSDLCPTVPSGIESSLTSGHTPQIPKTPLCDKAFLRVDAEAMESIHNSWASFNAEQLRLCETEFLRAPEDRELIQVAKDWAEMVWITADGRDFYLTHMITGEPETGALRVSRSEIRKTTEGYLHCLVQRRKFHSTFVQPKIRAVMALPNLSPRDKVEQCLVLRSFSPLAIESKVPYQNRDGSIEFRYVWEPVVPTFIGALLRDLSLTSSTYSY
ncbi:hypothetical protein DFP72DRAFT_1058313 [Ephemerocybe angulata]|uniref:Uncharacterized protein n=1 Tax=Ephemerocybe angulata TaxID=980116 RepID=A0A8H6MH50_9AGAR|nr:hypothetical protein DFP72DRAFT_1058313 [Tulosesus angulatus]